MLEREYKGHETARIAIQKLSPKNGDIIVVTFPGDILHQQMETFATNLTQNIKETSNVEIVVLCMKGDTNVSLVTEEQLNEAGYFKAEYNDEESTH